MLVFLINITTKLKIEYWKTKSNSKQIKYYLNTIQENSSQVFKEGSTKVSKQHTMCYWNEG